VPAEIVRALPWPVPALHARFIAAIYLAGLLAMLLALRAPTLAEVRIPIALAAIWTGMLFVVSMLHLDAFDFAKPQVWFWMGAYAVFPLWGGWLYVVRGAGATATKRPAGPGARLLGAVCLLLAAALLVVPAQAIALWPWKLPPLLASIYAGPFLAWGVAALMLAREADPAARRIVLASLLAFAVLALVASAAAREAVRLRRQRGAGLVRRARRRRGDAAGAPAAGAAVMSGRALAETRAWVERVVIGLNLCPFAKAPQNKGQVRYVLSDATDPEALLATLVAELERLAETPAERIETTLLVHPHVLEDFDDYNDFLDIARARSPSSASRA
jgi:hypothetical protein